MNAMKIQFRNSIETTNMVCKTIVKTITTTTFILKCAHTIWYWFPSLFSLRQILRSHRQQLYPVYTTTLSK